MNISIDKYQSGEDMLITKVTEARPLTTSENIDYQLVHWIPGRIRIRIPRLAYDSKYASFLKNLFESLDFVTSVRINPDASSLVLKYNSEGNATVKEQIFTTVQQASNAGLPVLPSSLRPPSITAVSSPSALDPNKDDAAMIAESKRSYPHLKEKTSKEYALLVRGNYSLFKQ